MFSKQLLVDIVNMFPNTHADLDKYLIKFDLDDKIDFIGVDSISKKHVKIIKYLIENQGIKDNFKNDIVLNIVEDRIINVLLNNGYYYSFDLDRQEFNEYPKLYRYLRFDGYDIDFENNKLICSLPEDINATDKEDNIIVALNNYDFATTKGHLEQAKASYLGGNYAALNGQLRTYTESLFMEMAKFIKIAENTNSNISNINPSNATTAMQVLAKCSKPVLSSSLNEWDGQNTGYIQGFWKRLHPEGCHPGLPNIDEVLFRFQLVILNTSNLLNRFCTNY